MKVKNCFFSLVLAFNFWHTTDNSLEVLPLLYAILIYGCFTFPLHCFYSVEHAFSHTHKKTMSETEKNIVLKKRLSSILSVGLVSGRAKKSSNPFGAHVICCKLVYGIFDVLHYYFILHPVSTDLPFLFGMSDNDCRFWTVGATFNPNMSQFNELPSLFYVNTFPVNTIYFGRVWTMGIIRSDELTIQ